MGSVVFKPGLHRREALSLPTSWLVDLKIPCVFVLVLSPQDGTRTRWSQDVASRSTVSLSTSTRMGKNLWVKTRREAGWGPALRVFACCSCQTEALPTQGRQGPEAYTPPLASCQWMQGVVAKPGLYRLRVGRGQTAHELRWP